MACHQLVEEKKNLLQSRGDSEMTAKKEMRLIFSWAASS